MDDEMIGKVRDGLMKMHPDMRELYLELAEVKAAQDRLFVEEYTATLCKQQGVDASTNPGYGREKKPHMVEKLERRFAEREAASNLKSDYVRQLLIDILELCPTDYFVSAPNGEWVIDPEEFRQLPHSVKRLVESVEFKFIRGERFVQVKFMSKTAALAMAFRCTLLTKAEDPRDKAITVPWDRVMKAAEKEFNDPVADRLKELEARIEEKQRAAGVPQMPVQT